VAKLNLLLLLVLVVCALGLVTSQYKARTLFSALDQAQRRERQLDVVYGQLQLEASTWGQHTRVSKIATETLGMHVPDPREVIVLKLPPEAKK
jgi:cell division protein FtsL